MADEVELLEIEILESKIRRLESENLLLVQENERLNSAVSDKQTTTSHLTSTNRFLLEENDRLQSTISDLEAKFDSLGIDYEQSLESQANEDHIKNLLGGDVDDAENDQIERSEVPDPKEVTKLRKEKEDLERSMEKLSDRVDRIEEDNTVVILALLTRQSDLEADLNKQTEIIRAFFERTVQMLRRTAEMMERGRLDGGDSSTSSWGFDEGMDSTVEIMALSIEAELAGLKRVLRRILARREDEEEEAAAVPV